MTIKKLKQLIEKMEAAGVSEDTKVYSEQASCNNTDCFVVARTKETNKVSHVYISDSSPDELIDELKKDGYAVEIM